MDSGLTVILPYDRPAQKQQYPCKTLYLLHGLGGSHTSWLRHTNVELYAREYGLALILPEVQRSFYSDMHYGPAYFRYISEELPALCGEMFHISTKPEDSYIMGMSMGGYGALRCALTYPEQYAGVASFSGAVDIRDAVEHIADERFDRETIGVLGPDRRISGAEDLFSLAEEAAKSAMPPRIFMTCGEQDFLFHQNQKMHQHLRALSFDLRYETWAGNHEWGFWDKSTQVALSHFFGEQRK